MPNRFIQLLKKIAGNERPPRYPGVDLRSLLAQAQNPAVPTEQVYSLLLIPYENMDQGPNAFAVYAQTMELDLNDKDSRQLFLQIIDTLLHREPVNYKKIIALLNYSFLNSRNISISLREACAHPDPKHLVFFLEIVGEIINRTPASERSQNHLLSLFDLMTADRVSFPFLSNIYTLSAGNPEANRLLIANMSLLLEQGLPAERVLNLCGVSETIISNLLPDALTNRDPNVIENVRTSVNYLLRLMSNACQITPIEHIPYERFFKLVMVLLKTLDFEDASPLTVEIRNLVATLVGTLSEPLEHPLLSELARAPYIAFVEHLITSEYIEPTTKARFLVFLLRNDLLKPTDVHLLIQPDQNLDIIQIILSDVNTGNGFSRGILTALSILLHLNDIQQYEMDDEIHNDLLTTLIQLKEDNDIDKKTKLILLSHIKHLIKKILDYNPENRDQSPVKIFLEMVRSLISQETNCAEIVNLLIYLVPNPAGERIFHPMSSLDKAERLILINIIHELWQQYKSDSYAASTIVELCFCYYIDEDTAHYANIIQHCMIHDESDNFAKLMQVLNEIVESEEHEPTEEDITTLFMALGNRATNGVLPENRNQRTTVRDTYYMALCKPGYAEQINGWFMKVLQRNFPDRLILLNPKQHILELMKGKFSTLSICRNPTQQVSIIKNCCELLEFCVKQQIISAEDYMKLVFQKFFDPCTLSVLTYAVKNNREVIGVLLPFLSRMQNNPDQTLRNSLEETLTFLNPSERGWLRGKLAQHGLSHEPAELLHSRAHPSDAAKPSDTLTLYRQLSSTSTVEEMSCPTNSPNERGVPGAPTHSAPSPS